MKEYYEKYVPTLIDLIFDGKDGEEVGAPL